MIKRKRYKFRCLHDQKINGDWKQTWSIYSEETGYHETMISLSGYRWRCMTSRCNPSGSNASKHRTYIGVTNNFVDFNQFVEWSMGEFGYDLTEMINGKPRPWQLDKDLLGNGKLYSEDICVFLPNEINTALQTDRGNNKLPPGVSYKSSNKKYVAQLSKNIDGKRVSRHLVIHSDPEVCFNYYKVLS